MQQIVVFGKSLRRPDFVSCLCASQEPVSERGLYFQLLWGGQASIAGVIKAHLAWNESIYASFATFYHPIAGTQSQA